MAKEKNISIKDIAKEAKVSVATVSRVINDNGRFSEETKKRVQKIIDKYGYSPNVAASGLRTSKLKIVAVVVPNLTNEFYSAVIQAIQNRLFSNGYSCTVFSTGESAEAERDCLNSIKALGVSGVIYSNGRYDLSSIIPGMPSVYIDNEITEFSDMNSIITLSTDHEQGGYIAGRKFAEDGCKKVLVIASVKGAQHTILRNIGFERACLENDMEIIDVIYPSKMKDNLRKTLNNEGAYKTVRDLIETGKIKKTDALFCQSDWQAVGALNALEEAGISVPEECEIIGYDDISILNIVSKPISSIRQNTEKLGKVATDSLLSMMNGKAIKRRQLHIEAELIERNTTR